MNIAKEYQNDSREPNYPFIDINGERFYLALHPRPEIPRFVCAPFDEADIIPEKDWPEEFMFDQTEDIRIKNQGRLSYCHSYAGALDIELILRLLGRPALLSGTGLGSLVTGSVNRGAGLEEVLSVITTQGVPLEDDVPEYDYRRSNWKSGWKERAAANIVSEWEDCGYDRIFEKITSGMLTGKPGIFGCTGPYGPHAMCPVGLTRKNGQRAWKIANSWGTGFGDRGFVVHAKSELTGMNQYGGWVVRVAGSPKPIG